MMDTQNKLIQNFDFSDITSGDYVIGDYAKYYSVTLSLDWDSLNDTDAVVSLLKRESTTASWNVCATYTLASATGSIELKNDNFTSKYLGYRIDAGGVTSGTLILNLTAKSGTQPTLGNGTTLPTVTATAGQTTITSTTTLTDNILVIKNGAIQYPTTDYTYTVGGYEITIPAQTGGEQWMIIIF